MMNNECRDLAHSNIIHPLPRNTFRLLGYSRLSFSRSPSVYQTSERIACGFGQLVRCRSRNGHLT